MATIIIEGPDASGKSTLAHYLADMFELTVQRSEGPPRHPLDIAERLERYAKLPRDIIYDRHPVVSEQIYAAVLDRPSHITPADHRAFYDADPLLIYCDPTSHRHHVAKPHDTEDHLAAVKNSYERLVAAYRKWALSHAHVVYRVGDDMARIAALISSPTRDIADFHDKHDIAYIDGPRHLPAHLRDFRIRFLAEELCEYAGVPDVTKRLIQSALHEGMTEPLLEDQFDALIDLVYVALGTSYLHGFPFDNGWSVVHRANMRKVRVERSEDSKRGSIYDVAKPAGWLPPSLATLVKR
jgi:predicted HAD superfamily Cof-like phosphohydrolase